MSDGRPEPVIDPLWHKLLGLASHEIRSPLSVLGGRLRMLVGQNTCPLTADQQQHLQAVLDQFARLKKAADDLTELEQLESGQAKFNRGRIELATVVSEAIRSLPAPPGRDVSARLIDTPAVSTHGDALKLKAAFGAILYALLRELISGPELAVRIARSPDEKATVRVGIAEPSKLDALMQLERSGFITFDEYRGGTGLSLPIARRVLIAHGGTLLGAPEESDTLLNAPVASTTSAVIILPALPE